MLLKRRMDYYLDSAATVAYNLNKCFPESKEMVTKVLPAFDSDQVYTAFSKKAENYRQLVADYDRGMVLIRHDGTYEQILKRYGLSFSSLKDASGG